MENEIDIDLFVEKFPHLEDMEDEAFGLYMNVALNICPALAKPDLWPILASFMYAQEGASDPSFPHRGIMAGAQDLANFAKTYNEAQKLSGQGVEG